MYEPSAHLGRESRVARRRFLQACVLGAGGLSLSGHIRAGQTGCAPRDAEDRSAIMIFNAGGPSQLDTWDPKPHAPREVRGPFQPISTTVPGIQISELFPRHACIADRLAWVRSCHHDLPAVHEVGWQLMQTGRFATDRPGAPHVGCAVAALTRDRPAIPRHVLLPGPLQRGDNALDTGQSAGCLGPTWAPWNASAPDHQKVVPLSRAFQAAFDSSREPVAVRERYGRSRFGADCLRARRLIEAGVRFVTINTFTATQNQISWDIHGRRPYTTMDELKEQVAPAYDMAFTALVEDLAARGMLDQTLVCSLAEFGRTPAINSAGGRDHWPHCWTVYFAGGGVNGGQVVGQSDACGGRPVERPVKPEEVVATIYDCLGFDLRTSVADSEENLRRLVDVGVQPIMELF